MTNWVVLRSLTFRPFMDERFLYLNISAKENFTMENTLVKVCIEIQINTQVKQYKYQGGFVTYVIQKHLASSN